MDKYLAWHINSLEMCAIHLALIHFLPFLAHSLVIIRTDNMAVVSPSITREAPGYAPLGTGQIFVPESIHVPGYLNLVADFLLRQKFRSGEWMLNRRKVAQIWEQFCAADVDQFTFTFMHFSRHFYLATYSAFRL